MNAMLEGNAHKTLVEQALAALETAVGVTAELPRLETEWHPGAGIPIALKHHQQAWDLWGQVRAQVDETVLRSAALGRLHGDRAVLITRRMPNKLADLCRTELNTQFIDAAGNAHLRLPGLFVWVQGRHALPVGDKRAARQVATPTAVRVIFALLCRPKLWAATYREIASEADVALGAVGRVFQDLRDQKLIVGKPRHWKPVEAGHLFDQWVALYPTVLRPKLGAVRFAATDPDWWKTGDLADGRAYWGGEVAAQRLTHHLRPAAFTLYLKDEMRGPALKDLVQRYRWRLDPKGPIEVLQAFWNFPPDPKEPHLVPTPLVYADLMATLDPRNRETADLLRENIVAAINHPA
jgi:hypothetical protein